MRLVDRHQQIFDAILIRFFLPRQVHTRILTHKWHELLVLTTSAYQAIHGPRKMWSGPEPTEHDFHQQVDSIFDAVFSAILTHSIDIHQVSANLVTLQTCLAAMMGRPLTLDQLRQDVGLMVERITHVTMMLQRCQLRMEEYVCLKVIAMLSQCESLISQLISALLTY